ncbi:Uncharacterised protein [Klebsiella pneumoniae]|nr:Uncharacterised protein [Klebsiella pneumoniae]
MHFAQVVCFEQVVRGKRFAAIVLGIKDTKCLINIVRHNTHQLTFVTDKIQKLFFIFQLRQAPLKLYPN